MSRAPLHHDVQELFSKVSTSLLICIRFIGIKHEISLRFFQLVTISLSCQHCETSYYASEI